jgi:hypothetical protein
MTSPIFVVGANRSGTTLVRLILNAHSQIAIPDELTYFGPTIHGIPLDHWRRPNLDAAAYEAFIDQFLETNCATLSKDLDLTDVKDDILSAPPSLRTPYQTVLEAWANHHGKARWGEKTPANLFYVDYMLEMFPDARFIYVVRDPRAGVASMQRVSFFPDDVVFNALNRYKHWRAGHRYLNASVPPTQRMTIRYEDLVQAPDETVCRICTFLDEPFEASMLDFYEDAERYMGDEAASNFNKAATTPISSDRIHNWCNRLTPAEVATIQSICTAEMDEFGYEPTTVPLNLLSLVEIFAKKLYWQVQSLRNPYRHYTVKDLTFARSRHRLGLL